MLINEHLRQLKTLFLLLLLLCTSNMSQATDKDSQQNIHIRTLAASCAACHGTQGNSHNITPVLAGLDKSYFATQMLEFKQGKRSSTVMHHHASGLTDEEIHSLADYFAQQKRYTAPTLQPQTLRSDDE